MVKHFHDATRDVQGRFAAGRRQPKTDRLILARYLREEPDRWNLGDEAAIGAAHAILVRWAEFERSGRLAELNETQLQGDFLREVFRDALGYARPVENKPVWNLEQHFSILGQTPDAVLGEFGQGQPHVPRATFKGSTSEIRCSKIRPARRSIFWRRMMGWRREELDGSREPETSAFRLIGRGRTGR